MKGLQTWEDTFAGFLGAEEWVAGPPSALVKVGTGRGLGIRCPLHLPAGSLRTKAFLPLP